MELNKLDLHIHSTYSDGSLTIKEIVDKAIISGMSRIAITDHDSIESWKEIDNGNFAIPVIKGVEISTRYKNDVVHILGYYLNDNGEYFGLINKLNEICEQRKNRVKDIIKKLDEFNIHITYEDVMKHADGAVARPHIVKAILEKYTDRGYTFDNLFENYLGNDKPAYIELKEFNSFEAINLLHENHCIAVLAHPWSIKKFDYRELLSFGIDGLECDMTKVVEDSKKYLEFAEDNNLIVTAGSDFHVPYIFNEIGYNYIEKDRAKSFLFKINK